MVKTLHFWIVRIALVFTFLQVQIAAVEAQNSIPVDCGSDVESVFTGDAQVHTYRVNNIEVGTELVLFAESLAGNYQNLRVDIELSAPSGTIISGWLHEYTTEWSYSYFRTEDLLDQHRVRTDNLSESGTYSVRIIGFTETGSPYRLYVSCVLPSGNVVSSNRMVNVAQFGAIIENEVVYDPEIHNYFISLQAGTSLSIFVESTALNYQNLRVDLALVSPRENLISDWAHDFNLSWYYSHFRIEADLSDQHTIETYSLPDTGIYNISMIAFTETGSTYILQVGCTLPDGTAINPGDTPPVDLTSPVAQLPSTSVPQPVFSGFGFPGLASIDFSGGIEVPIAAGQPLTIPVGGDIALYTFQSTSGSAHTLMVDKLTEGLSVGVVVINRATNEILFMGGFPHSDGVATELTIPVDGTYAIGIFRLDTSTLQGTSGAIQLSLD